MEPTISNAIARIESAADSPDHLRSVFDELHRELGQTINCIPRVVWRWFGRTQTHRRPNWFANRMIEPPWRNEPNVIPSNPHVSSSTLPETQCP